MDEQSSVIQLIKILIGVAWLDGTVQLEEQAYLQKIAEDKGVADDLYLKPWLYGLRSVSKQECYCWIEDYLGQHPTAAAYQQLLEELSGLIYSDAEVATEEAKLLTQIQTLNPANDKTMQRFRASLIRVVQKLYQGFERV